jgi:hypothetical protein
VGDEIVDVQGIPAAEREAAEFKHAVSGIKVRKILNVDFRKARHI